MIGRIKGGRFPPSHHPSRSLWLLVPSKQRRLGSSEGPALVQPALLCCLSFYSLLLVPSFAPRGFSPGTPVFPSPQKPAFPNSNSTRNQVDEEPLCGCATSKSLFIYLFIYYAFKTSVLRRRFLMSQGGWGEGQRQRAGQDGKGIERKRLLLFLFGYSAGVSADETRERNSNPQ